MATSGDFCWPPVGKSDGHLRGENHGHPQHRMATTIWAQLRSRSHVVDEGSEPVPSAECPAGTRGLSLPHRRPLVIALVVAVVTALLAPTSAAIARPDRPPASPPGTGRAVAPRATVPAVEWGECRVDDLQELFDEIEAVTGEPAGVPEGYECALYPVPLDHSRPRAGTIDLALIKRPADDPAASQGTVFVNPGGPGGSGFELVLFAGEAIVAPEVAREFDLIGFDPRGIARSAGLDCGTALETVFGYYPFVWPEDRADLRVVDRANKLVERDCARNGGQVRQHMSTTNVADDLELMRQAVGDEQLNFLGFSYGSYVGAMYANRYPDRVGAVVVDGILDPVAWATGRDGDRRPTLARLNSDVGAQSTLEEFFRLCDEVGPERCAFSGGSAERFDALYDSLAAQPVPFDFGFAVLDVDEQLLTTLALEPLYSSVFGFAELGVTLTFVELLAAGEPVEAGLADAARTSLARSVVDVPDNVVARAQFAGVVCSDGVAPRRLLSWQEAGERSVGYFGRTWAWMDGVCASWRVNDRSVYRGPFDRQTANPVLILTNRHDPATDIAGAIALREELPNSRLVVVEGWGHTTFGLSLCADAITTDYLLTRKVPSSDATCEQDAPVFAPLDLAPAPEPQSDPDTVSPLGVVPDAELEARVQQAEKGLAGDIAALVRRRELVLQHVHSAP
jgi:pimeloyl-ACP methyl ester carboxylesterase